jgi:DNA repair protein RecO (recombination protein O)
VREVGGRALNLCADVVDRTAAPDEPAERVHGLTRSLLALLDARPEDAHEGLQLAFRLKLLYALGVPPALGACVRCGRTEHLVAFDAAAGGVVCAGCQAGAPGVDVAALDFMVAAMGAPLAEAPRIEDRPARQVARAFEGVAAHHLGVDLRAREE